jgi:hypothetical protein
MTYRADLGANIAVDSTANIIRAMQRAPVAKPPVLIRPAPTPIPARPPVSVPKPINTSTPVLKVNPTKTIPKEPLSPPVFKASVSAPTATKSPTVSMKPVGGASLVTERTDTLLSKFTSSPLPLIAFGIGALLLFNRKGR